MDDFDEPDPDLAHDRLKEEEAEQESLYERTTGQLHVKWRPDPKQTYWSTYGSYPRGDAYRIAQELRESGTPAKVA